MLLHCVIDRGGIHESRGNAAGLDAGPAVIALVLVLFQHELAALAAVEILHAGIVFFDEAIQHDYYFLDAYMDKGQTLFESKNYSEALKTFELASTITPTYAEAYLWIGKTQEAMGKKDDARLNYQRAYGLDKTLKEAKDAEKRVGK